MWAERGFREHVLNDLIELCAILNFNRRSGCAAIADHKNSGRVLQADLRPQITVRDDLFFQLALRIDRERERRLIVIRELIRILAQVLLGDLRLVLKNIGAEIFAELFDLVSK